MIRILRRDGQNLPLLICDVCDHWIEDATEAAAVYATPPNNLSTSNVLVAHKGGCHEIAEHRLGGRSNCSWDELGSHLVNLIHNTGLSLESMKSIADRDDKFTP